jgi:hypothetical protein
MDINFSCGSCGQHMVIDEAGAGLVIKCPKCSQDVSVPNLVEPRPPSGADPAPLRRPENEQTVALKWVPPSGGAPKDVKK